MFKNINKVIKTLVITDFFYNSAFASFAPVFAIFITNRIHGGTASVVGLAVSVYWIVKSIFQLPIARVLDRFYGLVMAWVVPAWYSIFTRRVDKWRIGFEWSLESVFAVGMATAGAAALGGFMVDRLGFQTLFLAAGVLAMLTSLLFLSLRPSLFGRNHQDRVLPERRHQNF